MRDNRSRALCVIAGVLLVGAGVFCLTHQEAAVLSIAMLVGVMMLLSGLAELAMFAMGRSVMLGAGWLLLDGILTVVLSLFLLFNQMFTLLSLPFLFSMWLLFSGISRFVNSFELKRMGVPGWGVVTAVGAVLVIGGFMGLTDPIASLTAMGLSLGVALILEGIDTIVWGGISGKLFFL